MASIHARELIPRQVISANFTGIKNAGGDTIPKVTLQAYDKNFIGHLIAESITTAVKEITAIECVADVGGSLDGKYFVLQDDAGSVAFWIDVDDSGTTIPAGASAEDRAVELTTVTTGMTATQVASAIYLEIVADSKFEAGADNGDGTMTVQASTTGPKTDGADGDTGFTISESTEGTAAGIIDVKIQHSHDGNTWFDAITFTQVTANGGELVQVNSATTHLAQFIQVVIVVTAGRATITVDLLYDRDK